MSLVRLIISSWPDQKVELIRTGNYHGLLKCPVTADQLINIRSDGADWLIWILYRPFRSLTHSELTDLFLARNKSMQSDCLSDAPGIRFCP
jgi:hypothetical protein